MSPQILGVIGAMVPQYGSPIWIMASFFNLRRAYRRNVLACSCMGELFFDTRQKIISLLLFCFLFYKKTEQEHLGVCLYIEQTRLTRYQPSFGPFINLFPSSLRLINNRGKRQKALIGFYFNILRL
jgi:hypothetical protein